MWQAISHLREEVRAPSVENKAPKCERLCRWNDRDITWTNNEAQDRDNAGSGAYQVVGSIVTSRRSSLVREGYMQSSKNKQVRGKRRKWCLRYPETCQSLGEVRVTKAITHIHKALQMWTFHALSKSVADI